MWHADQGWDVQEHKALEPVPQQDGTTKSLALFRCCLAVCGKPVPALSAKHGIRCWLT